MANLERVNHLPNVESLKFDTEGFQSDVEGPQLQEWLREIEGNWGAVPEFEADPEKIRHLAVICDGNRRAAQEKGLNPYFGHRAGVEVIRGISRACRQWGIHDLTVWTWSTENWRRDQTQVNYVMDLAGEFLTDQQLFKELLENEVKFTHLGRKDRFPSKTRKALESLEATTAAGTQYHLNLAMDYGGRDEVLRAVQKIVVAGIPAENIGQETFSQFLDTANQPDPDLVVRTGAKKGEIPHTSGFMIWQADYAGWSFVSELFPNLTPDQLLREIAVFSQYQKRKGR